MADALDSKSGFSDEVWVQVPPPVPKLNFFPGQLVYRVFLCLPEREVACENR